MASATRRFRRSGLTKSQVRGLRAAIVVEVIAEHGAPSFDISRTVNQRVEEEVLAIVEEKKGVVS